MSLSNNLRVIILDTIRHVTLFNKLEKTLFTYVLKIFFIWNDFYIDDYRDRLGQW